VYHPGDRNFHAALLMHSVLKRNESNFYIIFANLVIEGSLLVCQPN